jgi:dTMP kinase
MAFITFEGIEGCGKSTQARRLAAALGPGTVLTHEPGGTALGRAIRELLLDPRRGQPTPSAEMLLFFADRAQHVAEVVRPAIERGLTVVSDRYADSSLAYQGYGRGLPLDVLRGALRAATEGLAPDVTFLLDVPVEIGLARVGRRGGNDRLESEVREFHERVRRGYLDLAGQEPERWVSLDGTREADAVAADVLAALDGRGITVGRGAR